MTLIRLSSVTVDCPDARGLAAFYASILDGEIVHVGAQWASVTGPNSRIDFQTGPTPTSATCTPTQPATPSA